MAFGFDAKIDEARTNRSIAVSSKNAIITARELLLQEDAYNNKYLHGDTLGNIGINDLIWYWLYERGLEGGNEYVRPYLDSTLAHWREDYEGIMVASLEPYGDRYPFYQPWWVDPPPDTRYLNGFYPPDDFGAAAEELNFATDYLNWNGDTRPTDNTWGHGSQGDSDGFLFHLWAFYETLGDSQITPGDSIVSGYIYASSAEATAAAKLYLYGDTVVPGTQAGKAKLGWGLRGRRSADADINTQQSGDWRYIIGNDAGDTTTFYGDSFGDVNDFLGTIPFKTNIINTLYALCQFGDSNGTYITHLKALKTELLKIEGDSNPLFTDPDIVSDLGDTSGAVDDLMVKVAAIIGDSGDSWDGVGDSTLWGIYNFLSDAGTDGTEGSFDDALDTAKTIGDSLRLTITNRHSSYTNVIGNTYSTDETDFTGARKWRTFWVKTRIYKPKSTLLSYDALGGSVTDAERQVANADEQLRTLYGDSNYHHHSYILTPLMLASFYDPKLDQDDGTVLQKKITSVFDGQQHASQYRIYRQVYTSASSTSITNTVWGDTYHYDTMKRLNEDTGFVETEYTDFGKIAYEGDSIQTGDELFLYKDNLISYPDGREGDTVAGVSVEPSKLVYVDPIVGDSEEIINPRAKYWYGLDAGEASGLIAYYPLNGNARDYSGNGYHGVINTGAGEYETGYIEECYHFDGDSSNVLLPTDIGTFTEFSVSVWVNTDTLTPTDPANRVIELRADADNRVDIRLNSTGDDKIYFFARIGAANYSTEANSAASASTWYHIVVTYDGTTFKLYIDATLQNDTTTGTSLSITPINNRLGSEGHLGTSSNWDGLIDEVRIYNRALTQTEVTGIYNTRAMTQPWNAVTGFWKGTTNVLNYPETIGDSTSTGDSRAGLWHTAGIGDTVELTNYYFDNKRFSKITAVNSDADIKQILLPGTFGDTLAKSWSVILKKGSTSGDTTPIYFLEISPATFYGTYFIHWNSMTVDTAIGDTSKTQAEWFTNEIVRVSGTSLPIGDTGDSHWFVIEPQESGTGTLFATAVQLEESTYATPYINGTRPYSTYYFTRDMPVSGTIECYVRGRQPFDDTGEGSDVFFEWGNDSTHRIALAYDSSAHTFQAYWDNGGTGRSLLNGDTYGDSEYHTWHHYKFIWNFGDTGTNNSRIIIDGDSGDTTWDGTPDAYYGDTDIITSMGIGGRVTAPNTAYFGGEITDLLIQDTTGDSGDTHYINGVPYFYADPFPINTNYVYRVQTVDSVNQVQGDTTKSFQSDLFDSDEGTTWNATSGDSILELGDSHDYRPDEYVVVDETSSSNGYYILTRVEDSRIFISPTLTAGDVTGKVYPTTSVVFIQE